MQDFRGQCHCGRVSVLFATAIESTLLVPRACDCSFCRKHGAAYLSDPAGRLQVVASQAATLHEYRQGANNGRFLLCADCGVLIAVVFDDEGRLYGAVNARCLDAERAFPAAVEVSPQALAPAQRMARWRTMWTANVVVVRP